MNCAKFSKAQGFSLSTKSKMSIMKLLSGFLSSFFFPNEGISPAYEGSTLFNSIDFQSVSKRVDNIKRS